MASWIHPEKIARSWKRRNDAALTADWRDYHRGVVRVGLGLLRELRDDGCLTPSHLTVIEDAFRSVRP
jgi:hypothetical protein